MTQLSDTQLVILSAACQRDDRIVLPLPDRIKGGAAAKVIGSLIAKGSSRRSPPRSISRSGARPTAIAASRWWRLTPHSRRWAYAADEAPQGADEAPSAEPRERGAKTPKPAPAAPPAPATRKTREGSKQAGLIDMLKRPQGVTIAEAANRSTGSTTPCGAHSLARSRSSSG